MALKEGDRAPDFALKSDSGETVRLSEELQKHDYAILAFFPAAFSPVCTTEMNVFQEALRELDAMGAGVLGISCDGVYALREWKARNGLEFPLLADFHPQGAVAEQYGVMGEDGTADRVLFLVDRDMRIRLVQDEGRKVNPGVGRMLDKLEELTGEEQPWKATGTTG